MDVISGEMEAKLGYYGAMLENDLRTGAMFDIGGGSTEILEVRDGEICQAQSLAVGSLNLFNQCVSKIWPKKEELRAMEKRVDEALQSADIAEEKAERACGIGGTARAVLKIANAYFGKDPDNRTLLLEEIEEICGLLCRRGDEARRLILRVCPDRIHTIIPGSMMMNALGHKLCRDRIFVSQYGVREGYLCHKLLNATT